MKRRDFLYQSAVLSAGLLTISGCEYTTSGEIGLQLYTLRDIISKDVAGVFKKIKQAGYSEVEMYGLTNDNNFFDLPVDAIVKLLKENDLTSPSGHYQPDDFLYTNGNGDDVKRICEVANRLSNKYVIIPWLDKEYRDSIEKYKQIAERLNLIGEICKKSGLQLAYHNHAFEFEDINKQHGYDILLNYTDSNLVKMQMDIYWVVYAGYDPVEIIKSHPGRFPLWHVKDMDKINRSLNTEVNKGMIDFKKIFAYSKMAGVHQYIIEQEDNYAPSYFGSIETSYKAVKSLLKSI